MDGPDVLVLGAGVAGTATAFGLAKRGLEACVIHASAGATALWNGVVDGLTGDLEAGERELLEALGLAVPRPRPRIVTALGTSREASGHDEALLDLESARPKLVLVPTLPRPSWDGASLAASLADHHQGTFDARPISVPQLLEPGELALSDGALARRFDGEQRAEAFAATLEAALERWRGTSTAILLPPWLGVTRSLRARLAGRLALAVGEPATTLAGAAGLRFAHRRQALFERLKIEVVRGRVAAVELDASRVTLHLSEGRTIHARGLVVASGGLISGALGLPAPEATPELGVGTPMVPRLAFEAPFLSVGAHGSPARPAGSRYGMTPDDFFSSVGGRGFLERVGILADAVGAIPGYETCPVRIVGDALADAPRTFGGALKAGIRAASAFAPRR